MRGPNFSNDPPPIFSPQEVSAKDILHADRAAHRAREEEAKKAALAISQSPHGPPRPPPKEPATPIPAALSMLKPASAFVMPPTPTLLPVTTPVSESTKRAMAASCTTPSGLVVFPKPPTGCIAPPPDSGLPYAVMREYFESQSLDQETLANLGASMSMEELASCESYSTDQKGLIFMKILEHKQLQCQPAASAVSADPPPAALDQPMLAPLADATADHEQMLKNKRSAKNLQAALAPAPVLTSATEAAARALSSTGALPEGVTSLQPGSAPPPPPQPKVAQYDIEYLQAKVPAKIAFTFSRAHDTHAKQFLCVFNGYEGQPICSSENGAWSKYTNRGNQGCTFKARVSDYVNTRAAYNDCLGWLLKMRVTHASEISEFSCSQCFNTHKGIPGNPAYCPAPDVDWTPMLAIDHPPCLQS